MGLIKILKRIGVYNWVAKLLLSYCAYTQFEGLKSMFNNALTFDFNRISVGYRCPFALMVPLRIGVMCRLFIYKLFCLKTK